MRKCPALLIAALVLQPGMAAACKLENATFRPKFSAEHFEIRSSRVGGNPIFDLTVRRTGETFRFRVDADASTGGGTITSVPDQHPAVGCQGSEDHPGGRDRPHILLRPGAVLRGLPHADEPQRRALYLPTLGPVEPGGVSGELGNPPLAREPNLPDHRTERNT
jgi:hypothetical protein